MLVNPNSFIITGTSGTGKTSVIEHLKASGYATYEEPTRLILQQQLAIDGQGVPSRNAQRFLDLMLEYCVRCLEDATRSPLQLSFFDRGIPDVAAYAIRFKVDPEKYQLAARQHSFQRGVFVLSPWKEIFVNDTLRGKSFAEYEAFHQLIVAAYVQAGCRLIDVPRGTVSERAAFIEHEARGISTQSVL